MSIEARQIQKTLYSYAAILNFTPSPQGLRAEFGACSVQNAQLLLSHRYGHPSEVVDEHLHRITDWQNIKEKDREGFERFADVLKAAVFSLDKPDYISMRCVACPYAYSWFAKTHAGKCTLCDTA